MDKISKFLKLLSKKQRAIFLKIFEDICRLEIDLYDVKALRGLPGVYRIRKGDIRVVFTKNQAGEGAVIDIGFRKDVYKKR